MIQVAIKNGILLKTSGLKCTKLNQYAVVIVLKYQTG